MGFCEAQSLDKIELKILNLPHLLFNVGMVVKI